MKPYLGTPGGTKEILKKYGFVFQKKYGQNCLIDSHVLEKIVKAAEIGEDDFVLEIGPGIGTMTQYLASAARKVVAVEIDRFMRSNSRAPKYRLVSTEAPTPPPMATQINTLVRE